MLSNWKLNLALSRIPSTSSIEYEIHYLKGARPITSEIAIFQLKRFLHRFAWPLFCLFTQSRTLAELEEVVGSLGDNISEELHADKANKKVRNCKLRFVCVCLSLTPFQTTPDQRDTAIHLHSKIYCSVTQVSSLQPKKVWPERAHLVHHKSLLVSSLVKQLSYLEDDASGILTVDGDIEEALGVVLVGDRHDSSVETDSHTRHRPAPSTILPPRLPPHPPPTCFSESLFHLVHNRGCSHNFCVFVYVTLTNEFVLILGLKGRVRGKFGRERRPARLDGQAVARRSPRIPFFFSVEPTFSSLGGNRFFGLTSHFGGQVLQEQQKSISLTKRIDSTEHLVREKCHPRELETSESWPLPPTQGLVEIG